MSNATEHDDDLDFGDDVETVEAGSTITNEQDSTDNTGDAEAPAEGTDGDNTESASEDTESDEDKAARLAAEQAEFDGLVQAFKDAADATLTHADRDYQTGTLPVAVVQPVKDAYLALPGAKGKTLGRAYLTEKMQEAMVSGATSGDNAHFLAARSYMQLGEDIKDAKAPKSDGLAKPKVDPTQAHAERVAVLMIAPNLVAVPDEVDENWVAKVEEIVTSLEADTKAYRAWLINTAEDKGDAPEVSPIVVAAGKVAVGRAVGTKRASSGGTRPSTAGSGHTGNIGEHIREAINKVEVGKFMSIAEIVNVETSQYGKDGAPKPSPGAIAARLFPKGDAANCNLDFVRPEGREQGHDKKGAIRLN